LPNSERLGERVVVQKSADHSGEKGTTRFERWVAKIRRRVSLELLVNTDQKSSAVSLPKKERLIRKGGQGTFSKKETENSEKIRERLFGASQHLSHGEGETIEDRGRRGEGKRAVDLKSFHSAIRGERQISSRGSKQAQRIHKLSRANKRPPARGVLKLALSEIVAGAGKLAAWREISGWKRRRVSFAGDAYSIER